MTHGACDCAFCRCAPSQHLPVPVRIRITDDRALVVWMKRVLPFVEVELACAAGVVKFCSLEAAVRHAKQHVPWMSGVTESARRLACTAMVKVGPGQMDSLWSRQYGATYRCNTDMGKECECRAPDDPAHYMQLPRHVRRKRNKGRAAALPPMDDASDVEGLAYDARELGGDPEAVGRVLRAHRVWNTDTVRALVRWGARPKLLGVDAGHEEVTKHGRCTIYRCIFVEPCGRRVRDVRMPKGFLDRKYSGVCAPMYQCK